MRIQPKLLIVAVVAAAVIALGGWWAASALRQPETSDYKRLDAQRQAVDASMNVYLPLFSGYTDEYAAVFQEDRSQEEQALVKQPYVDTLEQDRKVNIDRLNDMRSSVAMKESSVKSAFNDFDTAYRAVVNYYVQYAQDIATISETIAGKCDLNSDLNVASASLADDYTKAANECLAALAEAKETSEGPTKTLLSDVETLVKTRRDAFKKAIGKEGFEGDITKLSALTTLLSINSEIRKIQDKYESDTKATYTKLVQRANESNESFEMALAPFVDGQGAKE